MGWVGQHRLFVLSRFPPKQIYYRTLLTINCFNHGIGEMLPPLILMGIGLVGPYRQDRIEKQHSLISPLLQISVIRDRASKVIVKLFVNVLKGGRGLLARQDRKAQSMGLIHIMIRILSKYHDPNPGQGRIMEGIKNIVHRRKNLPGLIFLGQEVSKLFIVGLLKFGIQRLFPIIF